MGYSLPFGPESKVVELGGGERPVFHPNVDVRKGPSVDIEADLGELIAGLESSAYDGVYSSYSLEHVSWRKIKTPVKEAFRVLKPGGSAVFIIPNTEAQMRWALEQGDHYDKVAQCLFGDLDYAENSHKAAFNPEFAIRLFQEAGFSDIVVLPHGELGTDMIVEGRKALPPKIDPTAWTPDQRKLAYNRHYFDGGKGPVGGYSREGYWDYPVHWLTAQKIMERKPESVLELGCARGYILKRLEDAGVRVQGLEVSEHCVLTRVVRDVMLFDITQTPWPFPDKEFDLCFDNAVLEHIPENKIDAVCAEILRVTKRGLHGVDFGEHDDGFDKTHCLFRPMEWWTRKLNGLSEDSALGGFQAVVDKEDLERGPIPVPPGDSKIKLNCGSFTTMFHHGWLNIDIHPLEEFAKSHQFRYHRHDLRAGIPASDNVVDMIYASHFLEHLSYQDGVAFLRECYRTMKKGAIMRLLVPDAAELIEGYRQRGLQRFDEISDGCARTTLQAPKLWELLFSGHSAIYDVVTLVAALQEAGFTQVTHQGFRKSHSGQILRETVDLFPELSLFFEAVK